MKRVIGKIKDKRIVEGDCNLLQENEILLTESEDYKILRSKKNGKIKTFVIVPLEDFNNDERNK